jgi:hypothetical protein
MGSKMVRQLLRNLDLGLTVKTQVGGVVVGSGIGSLVGYAEDGPEGLLPGAAMGAGGALGFGAGVRQINKNLGKGNLSKDIKRLPNGRYQIELSPETTGKVNVRSMSDGSGLGQVKSSAVREVLQEKVTPHSFSDIAIAKEYALHDIGTAKNSAREEGQTRPGFVTMSLSTMEPSVSLAKSKKLFERTYEALEDHIIRHKFPTYNFSGASDLHDKLYSLSLARKGPPKGYEVMIKLDTHDPTTYPHDFIFIRKDYLTKGRKKTWESFGYGPFKLPDSAARKARKAETASNVAAEDQRRAAIRAEENPQIQTDAELEDLARQFGIIQVFGDTER